MKRSIRWTAVTVVCGFLMVALAVVASVRAADDEERPARASIKLDAAARLTELGKAEKDPSALISAGILLLQMPKPSKLATTDLTSVKSEDGEGKTADLKSYKVQADELFELAMKYTKDTATADVEKLIASAKQNVPVPEKGERGPVDGPKNIRRSVPKGVVDTWHIAFQKNVPAAINIQGDYKLHVEIIRPNGEHLLDVNAPSSWANFTPGNFDKWTIKISNNSGRGNAYTLTVN